MSLKINHGDLDVYMRRHHNLLVHNAQERIAKASSMLDRLPRALRLTARVVLIIVAVFGVAAILFSIAIVLLFDRPSLLHIALFVLGFLGLRLSVF